MNFGHCLFEYSKFLLLYSARTDGGDIDHSRRMAAILTQNRAHPINNFSKRLRNRRNSIEANELETLPNELIT